VSVLEYDESVRQHIIALRHLAKKYPKARKARSIAITRRRHLAIATLCAWLRWVIVEAALPPAPASEDK
jgi:hypothetical protein